MRSLFLKIFLSFWVAMLLIGGATVFLALRTDPVAAEKARLEKRYAHFAEELVTLYEEKGQMALAARLHEVEQKRKISLFLLKNGHDLAANRPLPRSIRNLSAAALASGSLQHHQIQHRPFFLGRGFGHRQMMGPAPEPEPGLLFALPVKDAYVLAGRLEPPSPLALLLDPQRLAVRLLLAALIAGAVSYLLARSLTAPIGRLRLAAQELAAGRLTTRVEPQLEATGDEIGDLAHDFNRMAERIEELVTSRERLLRDISHELRSPLTRLSIGLELARRQAGTGAEESLARIEKEAERLNELIGDLITINRIEGLGETEEKETLDLAGLLAEVAADGDFEARSRNCRVLLKGESPLPITASATLLRRAFENVVRNAVRYAPEESVVEIRLAREGKTGLCTITDQGPGVPESELEKIFHPFHRVADARDRQSGGTGLGLAIAARAVHLHGGKISAKNRREGGLEVTISLSLEAA